MFDTCPTLNTEACPECVSGNPGCAVEVRGVVTGESELQFGDLNRFDGDFDMGSYEQMLDYYH